MVMEETRPYLDDIIFDRILEIGCRMLVSGGEVHRVEDTINRLCKAYNAVHVNTLAITSSIVVSAKLNDGHIVTQTRRIKAQSLDMQVLSKLNVLSRKICASPLSEEEINKELALITPSKNSVLFDAFLWALISGCFTMFFGGNVLDALFSMVIGVVMSLQKRFLSKIIDNPYFVIILCSVVGGALSLGCVSVYNKLNAFYINIGNIMLLIPGVTITLSIRDMLVGDTITGLIKIAESFIVAMLIALGFALFDLNGAISQNVAKWWVQLITAGLGTFGFALLFRSTFKVSVISLLGGAFCWGIVILIQYAGVHEYLGFLFAGIIAALFAEIMAIKNKCPATLFLLASIIPLVPGKSLYVTMRYAVLSNWQTFLSQGVATLIYAASIAAGASLIAVVYALLRKYKRKKRI